MARVTSTGGSNDKQRNVLRARTSSDELSALLDPTRELYGVGEREVKGMAKMLGVTPQTGRINPFQSLPVSPGSDFYDAIEIFEGDEEEESGEFYDPTRYSNYADEPLDNYDAPAPLTVLPTSTTNYQRPRTVAAGYDPKRETLTVVFRDGLFYNYYDVKPSTWSAFKATVSKGRFIKQYLDSHARGDAAMGTLPTYARETLYRIVRTNQIYFEGRQSLVPTSKTGYGVTKKPRTQASKPKTTALKSSRGNKKKR